MPRILSAGGSPGPEYLEFCPSGAQDGRSRRRTGARCIRPRELRPPARRPRRNRPTGQPGLSAGCRAHPPQRPTALRHPAKRACQGPQSEMQGISRALYRRQPREHALASGPCRRKAPSLRTATVPAAGPRRLPVQYPMRQSRPLMQRRMCIVELQHRRGSSSTMLRRRPRRGRPTVDLQTHPVGRFRRKRRPAMLRRRTRRNRPTVLMHVNCSLLAKP
jgi:hypothetical protein